jgi:hypothetical protein
MKRIILGLTIASSISGFAFADDKPLSKEDEAARVNASLQQQLSTCNTQLSFAGSQRDYWATSYFNLNSQAQALIADNNALKKQLAPPPPDIKAPVSPDTKPPAK